MEAKSIYLCKLTDPTPTKQNPIELPCDKIPAFLMLFYP